ncbi:MAG: sensor histidine kinase [Bacillota bacterium]
MSHAVGALKGALVKIIRPFAKLSGKLNLARKLMLIYTVVLGITITTFAFQLIREAEDSTEKSFLNDTKNLLKETRYDIANRMDICYKAVSSLLSDYDLMSSFKDWNREDKPALFEFSMNFNKKIEQIIFLSTDVYLFRVYIYNKDFPEIGSIVYSAARLPNMEFLAKKVSESPNGYWLVNHPENNFNTSQRTRKNVVSLYMPLRYSIGENIGIIEVSMPVELFFRHMFSQGDNKKLFAFAVDSGGNLIYNPRSEFITLYGIDESGLKKLLGKSGATGQSGGIPVKIGKIPMSMVYDYLEGLDCSIYYIVSNEDFAKGLRNTTMLIIAESLLSLLVLSVLTYFLTRIVFKKMKQIIASMRKVGEGKLGIVVDTAGQDEMSEMAYHFNKMSGQLVNLVSEVIKKQEAKKNAEIHALFSQINAHFIINTLENIRMMSEAEGKFEIADAITSLGKLLRYGLKWTSEYAMLREEIEYIKSYIDLVNIRYDFVIRLETIIPPELMDYKVLRISLQPIVENSIHRGIVPLERDGLLTIRAFTDGEFTIIEITDNGTGMDAERLESVRRSLLPGSALDSPGKDGSGIGLKNVNERIRFVYGEKYGIHIDSVKNEYTKVTMKLPA